MTSLIFFILIHCSRLADYFFYSRWRKYCIGELILHHDGIKLTEQWNRHFCRELSSHSDGELFIVSACLTTKNIKNGTYLFNLRISGMKWPLKAQIKKSSTDSLAIYKFTQFFSWMKLVFIKIFSAQNSNSVRSQLFIKLIQLV